MNKQPVEISISLNRWHKVTQRLAERRAEVLQAMSNTLQYESRVTIQNNLPIPSTDAIKAKFRALDEEFDVIVETINIIKTRLGVTNAAEGISDHLNKKQFLLEMQRKEEIIFGAVQDKVKAEQLDSIKSGLIAQANRKDALPIQQTTVMIQLLTDDEIADRAKRIEQYKIQGTRELDEMSDINGKKVKISIPAHAAVVAGVYVESK